MDNSILQLELKKPAVVMFDNQKLENHIEELTEKYGNMVVTEENIKQAAKDRASLAKLQTEIKKRLKQIKDEMLDPIDDLDNSVKKAIQKIDKLYRNIKNQEDNFDEIRRNQELKKLEEIRDRIIEEKGITEEYASMIEIYTKMLNKTAKRQDSIDKLESMADAAAMTMEQHQREAKAKRDMEDAINRLCALHSESYGLQKPLNPIRFSDNETSSLDDIEDAIIMEAQLQQKEEQEKEREQKEREQKEREREREARAQRQKGPVAPITHAGFGHDNPPKPQSDYVQELDATTETFTATVYIAGTPEDARKVAVAVNESVGHMSQVAEIKLRTEAKPEKPVRGLKPVSEIDMPIYPEHDLAESEDEFEDTQEYNLTITVTKSQRRALQQYMTAQHIKFRIS